MYTRIFPGRAEFGETVGKPTMGLFLDGSHGFKSEIGYTATAQNGNVGMVTT